MAAWLHRARNYDLNTQKKNEEKLLYAREEETEREKTHKNDQVYCVFVIVKVVRAKSIER